MTSAFVYLIKAHDRCEGLYKIGIADDVEKRMNGLAGLPFNISLVAKVFVSNAIEIESLLHGRFASKRVRGEWFELSSDDVRLFTDSHSLGELLNALDIALPKHDHNCKILKVYPAGSYNFISAFCRLQSTNGKWYSAKNVAASAGLRTPLVSALLKHQNVSLSDVEVSALLTFFAAEGMPVTVGDLFTVTSGE